MTYEYMMGMGTNGSQWSTEGLPGYRTADEAAEAAYEYVDMDFSEPPSQTASGGSLPPLELRPMPAELQEEAEPVTPAAEQTVEKQTWWTGDIGGMVDSFFNKLGIGQQAQQQAENTARVEGAVATASSGPTSISEVAPETAQAPTVTGGAGAATPWYVQYAPHMVIGGLGIGAVLTLVLVMRKR